MPSFLSSTQSNWRSSGESQGGNRAVPVTSLLPRLHAPAGKGWVGPVAGGSQDPKPGPMSPWQLVLVRTNNLAQPTRSTRTWTPSQERPKHILHFVVPPPLCAAAERLSRSVPSPESSPGTRTTMPTLPAGAFPAQQRRARPSPYLLQRPRTLPPSLAFDLGPP